MLKKLLLTLLLFPCFFVKAQLVKDSLRIENHYRVFYFNKPPSERTGGSLIFAMHGSGGDPQSLFDKTRKLEAQAEKENFLLVYPAGYKRYWNECRKASTAAANQENINEEAFFLEMIAYFKTKYKINDQHVFASGFSGGGHMTYKLALTLPTKFKAISAIVANMPTDDNLDCGEAKIPIAAQIINGTADETNPYNGGEVKTSGVTLGKVRSTEQSFQYWASLDGHKGKPVKTILPDADTSNDITVESYSYRNKNKPEVTLLKVVNGKHQFLTDIDMFEESWKFFKRQIAN
jgi:polyhydroxybutyrate depolymerase